MKHPLEWSEDCVVLLADEQVQLSCLSSAACRVGSRADGLRARTWQALLAGDRKMLERCAAEAPQCFDTPDLRRDLAERA